MPHAAAVLVSFCCTTSQTQNYCTSGVQPLNVVVSVTKLNVCQFCNGRGMEEVDEVASIMMHRFTNGRGSITITLEQLKIH